MGDVMNRVRAMSETTPKPPEPKPTEAPAMVEAIEAPAIEAKGEDTGTAVAPADTVPTRERESEATGSRSHVETLPPKKREKKAGVPKGFNVRPERVEKPHQSIYAHPLVFRAIRTIAASEDMKPQDLYREGLRAVLKKRGLDFDKLDRGEE